MPEDAGSTGDAGDENGAGDEAQKGKGTEGSEKPSGSNRLELPPEAQALVDSLKAEAIAANKALKETKASLKKIEDSQKSELELATSRTAELEKELASREDALADLKLGTQVVDAATDMGFLNPTLARNLVDRKAIVLDESGKATNLDTLLKVVVDQNPYLVGKQGKGKGNAGAGAGRPAPVAQDMNSLLRRGR